jgi:hypothetical protein
MFSLQNVSLAAIFFVWSYRLGGWLRYILSRSVGGCFLSCLVSAVALSCLYGCRVVLSLCIVSVGGCGLDSSQWVAMAISCLDGLQLHCLVVAASCCLGRWLLLQKHISLGFYLPHFIFGISFSFSLSSTLLLWVLHFALIDFFDLQVRYMFAVVHLVGSLLR